MKKTKLLFSLVVTLMSLGAQANQLGLSLPDHSKRMDILGYCSPTIAGNDTAIPLGAKVLYYSSELKRFYVQGFGSFGLEYPGSDRVQVKSEFQDVNEVFESNKRLVITVSFDFSIVGPEDSETRKATFILNGPDTVDAKMSFSSVIERQPRPAEVQNLSGANCRAFGSGSILEDFGNKK